MTLYMLCWCASPQAKVKVNMNQLESTSLGLGVGEIGLDYYYDFSDGRYRKEYFPEQIDLAKSLDLPVVIHDRDAHKDTLDILKDLRPLKGLMHCYSGSF